MTSDVLRLSRQTKCPSVLSCATSFSCSSNTVNINEHYREPSVLAESRSLFSTGISVLLQNELTRKHVNATQKLLQLKQTDANANSESLEQERIVWNTGKCHVYFTDR